MVEKKMRLTLHTDYALRVLIRVAMADGKLITIDDVAKTFDISKQHLMKVAADLSRKGYLDTVRGRNGGIRLRLQPRDINVGQVVRHTEDKLDVIGCLERRGYCPIERACVLRGVLRDATKAFLAVLDAYTLADLIEPKRALSSLLLLDQYGARRGSNKGSEKGVRGGSPRLPLPEIRYPRPSPGRRLPPQGLERKASSR